MYKDKDKVKYAVVIINSDVNSAPRFIRQMEALKTAGYDLIIFSHSERVGNEIVFQLPTVYHKPVDKALPVIIRKMLSLRYRVRMTIREWLNQKFYYDARAIAKSILKHIQPYQKDIKVIVVHHLNNLPTGSFVAEACGVKLIFNAHEFYPEQFSGSAAWERHRARLNNIGHDFLKKTYKIFTVCPGIQERYQKDFSLSSNQQVCITNATSYNDLTPSNTGEKIKLIHHGIANSFRKLELMIEVADKVKCDSFEFYFMLVPSPTDTEYFDYIKKQIHERQNCFLLDPVPTIDIPRTINKYDLGLYMYEPGDNFNMKHYLPNKLFEFIQGRLGIVIGPYVEMKDLVQQYKLGVVAEYNKTSTFAEIISSITRDDVRRYKMNADIAAMELNGEREIAKMADVFTSL